MKKGRLQSGLSMIELLIVVAVLAILIIMALTTLPQQVNKSRDSRRKSDLQKIKIAFENYYSDKDCYPPKNILDNCGGTQLAPYLPTIPCDPQTRTKYLYAPEGAVCPRYYRIFSNLEIDVDPVIKELGCDTASGCGAYAYYQELGLGALKYNYGVSEGVPVYVTNGNIPPGTSGSCCNSYGIQCNGWTSGDESVCVKFYFTSAECNLACGYTGPL
ncbi:type II secretion system protein [Candidatus Woesebacteria bacterium]|nr:type II secretion system protein [Candidatus Woesebacteria bacterium]